MSEIISSEKLGIELCKVLGLDSKKTISINITLEAGSPAIVETRQYMFENESDSVLEVLAEYNLERTDKTKEIIGTKYDDYKPTFNDMQSNKKR